MWFRERIAECETKNEKIAGELHHLYIQRLHMNVIHDKSFCSHLSLVYKRRNILENLRRKYFRQYKKVHLYYSSHVVFMFLFTKINDMIML